MKLITCPEAKVIVLPQFSQETEAKPVVLDKGTVIDTLPFRVFRDILHYRFIVPYRGIVDFSKLIIDYYPFIVGIAQMRLFVLLLRAFDVGIVAGISQRGIEFQAGREVGLPFQSRGKVAPLRMVELLSTVHIPIPHRKTVAS